MKAEKYVGKSSSGRVPLAAMNEAENELAKDAMESSSMHRKIAEVTDGTK